MEIETTLNEMQLAKIDTIVQDLLVTHPPVPGLREVKTDLLMEVVRGHIHNTHRVYGNEFQFQLYYNETDGSLTFMVVTSPEATDSWQDNRWMRDISTNGKCFVSRPTMVVLADAEAEVVTE